MTTVKSVAALLTFTYRITIRDNIVDRRTWTYIGIIISLPTATLIRRKWIDICQIKKYFQPLQLGWMLIIAKETRAGIAAFILNIIVNHILKIKHILMSFTFNNKTINYIIKLELRHIIVKLVFSLYNTYCLSINENTSITVLSLPISSMEGISICKIKCKK